MSTPLLNSRKRLPNLAKKFYILLYTKERSSSSIGNYFSNYINVTIIAEYGLNKSLVMLVK
jgi:hypothetical protein